MVLNNLITDHLDIWTAAIKTKSAAGRGSSKKLELVGVNKLRELILELAVRGKLVPQDPNDEPARDLLKNIEAEKARLVKEGKIKKQKSLPKITEEEMRFELPRNWEWERLTNLYDVRDGTHDTPKYHESGYPLVTSKNISSGTLDLTNVKLISEEDYIKINERSKVERNDILFAMIGSIGNPVLVDIEPEFSIKNVALFKYYSQKLSSPSYLLRFLLFAETTMKAEASGAVQSFVSLGAVRKFVMAVPPLEEQHRIVAKVDELMDLCDQLEKQTEASIDAHQLLVEELLSTLTNSENAQAFEQNWARIAEHFDLLFTTEHSIEQLKQTLLQLAVMGKLVPQDPTDEPASKLLERIAQEKEQLIKDKVIKKEKALPALTDEEKSLDLPTGWALARVGSLVSKLGSGSTPRGGKSAYVDSGIPFLRSQNVWNDGLKTADIAYIPEETHNSMSNTKVYPNDVLLNITGASLGRATIFPTALKEANVSQHVTIIRLIEKEMSEFLLLGIHSPMIQRLVWDRQVGVAIEGLSKKVLELFEFPIPPLSEQKRIISKVQSLITLCDQLKLSIIEANSTQLYLAESIVEKALGRTLAVKLEAKEEKKAMKISTELSLGSVTYGTTAILAPLISESGADAKSVWSKSGLKLPEFYRQLKLEITSGFIAKPAKAEFEG